MATITKRGNYQFQAIVRRKGYPSQTKTFESKAEAERWVREIEATIDSGYFRDRREVERTTLGQALQKYLESVSARKRGVAAERNRIRQFQAHPLALRPMASLRAKDALSNAELSTMRSPITLPLRHQKIRQMYASSVISAAKRIAIAVSAPQYQASLS